MYVCATEKVFYFALHSCAPHVFLAPFHDDAMLGLESRRRIQSEFANEKKKKTNSVIHKQFENVGDFIMGELEMGDRHFGRQKRAEQMESHRTLS